MDSRFAELLSPDKQFSVDQIKEQHAKTQLPKGDLYVDNISPEDKKFIVKAFRNMF